MSDFENFNKAPPEKRTAVLNAGYFRFGRDGYKKTAMSEIAKTAGVSKASLFHYFGAKKDLYAYLFRTACETIAADFGEGSEDFFECMRQGVTLKLRILEKHPGMYDFLLLAVQEQDAITSKALVEAYAGEAGKAAERYFSRVDWSRLCVPPEKAKNIVRWMSDGIAREYASYKTADEIGAEYESYLQIIKPAIYKEEYL
ncbi:TetR/AcrR family transcriptional regulator [Clostridiaceae bacterium OttesenSCG-928-D20]|nr:TetR/AcrR family transcriptional regulator [Clostridiaceae bacterium OttesenSCG-928-D20]